MLHYCKRVMSLLFQIIGLYCHHEAQGLVEAIIVEHVGVLQQLRALRFEHYERRQDG